MSRCTVRNSVRTQPGVKQLQCLYVLKQGEYLIETKAFKMDTRQAIKKIYSGVLNKLTGHNKRVELDIFYNIVSENHVQDGFLIIYVC